MLLGDAAEPEMAGAAVEPMGTVAQLSAAGLPNGLRKEVFGFLPYWMLTDAALASMNYQLVSTIAYFSVNANMEGNLVKGPTGSPTTGWAGWTSSLMTDDERFVELQGTAEHKAFDRGQMNQMVDLAAAGIKQLFVLQRSAIDASASE